MLGNDRGSSRSITLKVSDETRREDLEKFRQKALSWGASMADTIPADRVELDERVRLKCSVPLCPDYDKRLFFPPHSPSPEVIRAALHRYMWALLSALDVKPVSDIADRSIVFIT